jgi:translation initiation factor 3 subunit B
MIRKNLREYSRQFDEEDAAEESTVSAELIAHRRRLVDEWNAWRVQRKSDAQKLGAQSADEKKEESQEEVEVWVEELLDEVEEEILD